MPQSAAGARAMIVTPLKGFELWLHFFVNAGRLLGQERDEKATVHKLEGYALQTRIRDQRTLFKTFC